MSKEMDFFIYLIEQYAMYKGIAADKVLSKWDELGITDTVFKMYERYHCEAISNAFEDIDLMMAEV